MDKLNDYGTVNGLRRNSNRICICSYYETEQDNRIYGKICCRELIVCMQQMKNYLKSLNTVGVKLV